MTTSKNTAARDADAAAAADAARDKDRVEEVTGWDHFPKAELTPPRKRHQRRQRMSIEEQDRLAYGSEQLELPPQ